MGSVLLFATGVILYFALSAQVGADAASTEDTVIVNIAGQGSVLGNHDTTAWTNQRYMQFRGIPFAESPSGNLRFQLPVPRKPWQDTYNATHFGYRCPIRSHLPENPEGDVEDCLNLSVYTKSLTEKRPVMFYIYGGGFANGSAADHPPKYLLEKDIVLVVTQYRVQALGWFAMLTPEMPGNVAWADILLSLEWVQKNIHHFGGDPQQVTVFSQSAGGAATSALLISPNTPANAFQKAIVQSGSVFAEWSLRSNHIAQATQACEALECNNCSSKDGVRECLINAPLYDLLKATETEKFRPIIGDLNGIIPATPLEMAQSYNLSKPLMTGFLKHDGTFVLAEFYDGVKATGLNFSSLTVRQFSELMMEDIDPLSRNVLFKLMFPNELLDTNRHKEAIPYYFDLCSTVAMKSPTITLADTIFKTRTAPVYLYTFDYEGANTRFGYEFGNEWYPFEGGVHHSNDNIYLFNTHTLNEKDTLMAKRMVELWTSFAIDGQPRDPTSSTEILPLSNSNGPYFHIDSTIRVSQDVLNEFMVTIEDPNNQRFIRPNVPF